jgi:hypothetical protein
VGLELILSADTPFTEEKRIPSEVDWEIRQTGLGVSP